LGFFQMRQSIWNNGAYAGYSDQPQRQLDWFLDHAAAVKKQRLAAGQPVDAQHYGDWVADVERPAPQYRGRYQLRFDDARSLVEQAGKPRNSGAGQLVDAAPGGGATAGPRALSALAEAKKQLGVRYQWGGSSPRTGFDCSGLMQWAYAKVGIRIPRTSEEQILASNGTPVSQKNLRPGDLVFFRDSTGDVHHVGISLGGDKFIDSPHTGDVVKIDSLKEPYYAQQFAGGRRFDHASAAPVQANAASANAASANAASANAASAADARANAASAQAVREAQAALDRDAAEVARPGTALHQALQRQESGKGNEVQFLKAVELLRSSRA
jgi:cell wall-associated NlpC family hydrolase